MIIHNNKKDSFFMIFMKDWNNNKAIIWDALMIINALVFYRTLYLYLEASERK